MPLLTQISDLHLLHRCPQMPQAQPAQVTSSSCPFLSTSPLGQGRHHPPVCSGLRSQLLPHLTSPHQKMICHFCPQIVAYLVLRSPSHQDRPPSLARLPVMDSTSSPSIRQPEGVFQRAALYSLCYSKSFQGSLQPQGQRPSSSLAQQLPYYGLMPSPPPASSLYLPTPGCPPCIGTGPSLSCHLPPTPTSFSSDITSSRKPSLRPRTGFTIPQHPPAHQLQVVPQTVTISPPEGQGQDSTRCSSVCQCRQEA